MRRPEPTARRFCVACVAAVALGCGGRTALEAGAADTRGNDSAPAGRDPVCTRGGSASLAAVALLESTTPAPNLVWKGPELFAVVPDFDGHKSRSYAREVQISGDELTVGPSTADIADFSITGALWDGEAIGSFGPLDGSLAFQRATPSGGVLGPLQLISFGKVAVETCIAWPVLDAGGYAFSWGIMGGPHTSEPIGHMMFQRFTLEGTPLAPPVQQSELSDHVCSACLLVPAGQLYCVLRGGTGTDVKFEASEPTDGTINTLLASIGSVGQPPHWELVDAYRRPSSALFDGEQLFVVVEPRELDERSPKHSAILARAIDETDAPFHEHAAYDVSRLGHLRIAADKCGHLLAVIETGQSTDGIIAPTGLAFELVTPGSGGSMVALPTERDWLVVLSLMAVDGGFVVLYMEADSANHEESRLFKLAYIRIQ